MNKTSHWFLAWGIALAVGLSACGSDDTSNSKVPSHEQSDGAQVRKNSKNTWEIYDKDSWPERYVDQTCDTENRPVIDLNTPGEAYEWLEVVCGEPQQEVAPTATPVPTVDPLG